MSIICSCLSFHPASHHLLLGGLVLCWTRSPWSPLCLLRIYTCSHAVLQIQLKISSSPYWSSTRTSQMTYAWALLQHSRLVHHPLVNPLHSIGHLPRVPATFIIAISLTNFRHRPRLHLSLLSLLHQHVSGHSVTSASCLQHNCKNSPDRSPTNSA